MGTAFSHISSKSLQIESHPNGREIRENENIAVYLHGPTLFSTTENAEEPL